VTLPRSVYDRFSGANDDDDYIKTDPAHPDTDGLRAALAEVDAAMAEIIRTEVADPAERERLLAKLAALAATERTP
jgi:hypothetical protein